MQTKVTYPPTKSLPEKFTPVWQFDIHSKKDLLVVNLLGFVIFILSWIGFAALAKVLRPEADSSSILFSTNDFKKILLWFVTILLVTAIMVVVHEAFHGIFFWLFTRSRPKFAFKGFYAYAAAPDWYIPRWRYVLIGLAPLGGITLLGIMGLAWLPAWMIVPSLWLLVLNTSGAVGDLWVVVALLFQRSSIYVKDSGDLIEFFGNSQLTPNDVPGV